MDQITASNSLDDDWFLIQKNKEGDRFAFEQLFNKYKVSIVNLAFRFVREKTAAEDIAQEVFIKIYEKKVHFDPKAKFSTWLYRVTVNAAMDVLRKRKFSPQSLDEPIQGQEGEKKSLLDKFSDQHVDSALKGLEDQELQMLVQLEITRLPEKLREVILLYQFENLSYCEIASILGTTEKGVEKRIYHAKEKLRKRLAIIYKTFG